MYGIQRYETWETMIFTENRFLPHCDCCCYVRVIVYLPLFLLFVCCCFFCFTALSLFHWNTINASDRDVIRVALLSSIIYFSLQTLGKWSVAMASYPLLPRDTSHRLWRVSSVTIRFDYISFLSPVQLMHWKFGLLSWEKRAAIELRYPSFFLFFFWLPPLPVLCSVLSCVHITGCEAYSITTDGYGISNMRKHKCGYKSYTRKGDRHEQVCTRVDSEGQNKCSPPCPARGSNPGSSGLNSDPLTTELRPPFSLPTVVSQDMLLLSLFPFHAWRMK